MTPSQLGKIIKFKFQFGFCNSGCGLSESSIRMSLESVECCVGVLSFFGTIEYTSMNIRSDFSVECVISRQETFDDILVKG